MKWRDVKVSKLPEIQKLREYNPNDIIELMDRDVALLSLITGKDEGYFNLLKSAEFNKYRIQLHAFLATEPTTEFKPVFKIGGRKFTTWIKASEVTTAQLADIHLLKIDGKNYYSKLPEILAVFATEKKGLMFWKKHLTFSQKVELFKDLPSDTANSISLFFCTVSPKLEAIIKNYLESEIESKVTNLMNSLSDQQRGQGGVGSKQSTNSRTETRRKKRNI